MSTGRFQEGARTNGDTMTNHTNDMTTMPGNPHAWMLLNSGYTTESLVYTQREATLALAFEQRTQTLLAVATATFADGSAMFPGQIDSVRRQITDRLGMGETDDQ